jgi:hypothetical protein
MYEFYSIPARLQSRALNAKLAQDLPDEIREGYLQIFQAIDVNGRGTVSVRVC